MADKSLKRVWFALYRETNSDAGRVQDDPVGVFSCRLSTQRFLDIPDTATFQGEIYVKRSAHSRIFTLADGTNLAQSSENSNGQVEESKVPIRKRVGKRRVIIQTGKRIYPNDPKKTQRFTISFAFPKWADIRTISEALGEIIPEGKLDTNAGNTEVFPYFTIPNGGTYAIMKRAAAISSNAVSTSAANIKTKIQSKGGEVI